MLSKHSVMNLVPDVKQKWKQKTKTSIALAQKEICGWVEQNRGAESTLATFNYLIFDKGARNINWKKIAALTSDAGKIGYIPKKMESRLIARSCTKIVKIDQGLKY